MNLAQLLNVAALQSYSSPETLSVCGSQSKALISCLRTNANFTQFQSENCLLCTVSASEDSNGEQSAATICDEFEADGYCTNLNQCFREDCSNKCREEYKTWAMCLFDDIDCPFLCRRKKRVFEEIA